MDIPKDLLQEIFIRLSYKDVAICKCVCTSWYNLLSGPHFTRLYTSRTPYAAVFTKQVCPNKSKSFLLLEFGPNGEFIRTPINPIDKDLVGTENRTRLLSSRARFSDHVTEKLYLSDMLSGECVEVAEFKLAHEDWESESEYKISYVPEIKTHKILSFNYINDDDDDEVFQVVIFTVGVDLEWRIVDDRFPFLCPMSDGVCFRGFYHWVPDSYDSAARNICTFDFLNEKWSEIPKPLNLEELLYKRMKLRVLNDRLSLIGFSDEGDQIIIWTMEEYGVADSWSKKVVLRAWLPPDMRRVSHYIIQACGGKLMSEIKPHFLDKVDVVTVLPNGSIVLYLVGSCSTFIYVNTEKKKSTKVNVPGVDDRDNISSNYARFYPLRLI